MTQIDNKWYCKSCTFANDEYLDACEMCQKSRPTQWQCFKCTVLNDPEHTTCDVCGASKIMDTSTDIKQSIESNQYNNYNNQQWKCMHCTTINSNKTDKCCKMCNNYNPKSFWQCDKCTYVNDKSSKSCVMCTQDTQQLVSLSNANNINNMGVFVSFVDDKHKNKTVTVLLSQNNMIQRKHFDNFKEILTELNSSALFINASFMEQQLDANKYHFATTFIDVIQELAAYLRKNNEEILHEIKLAIECQTYQPNNVGTVQPIWNHLNNCVIGLFECANEFLDFRDEFITVLMDIMWKPNKLNIKESIIQKLKQNIEKGKNEELKINQDNFEGKVFKSLNTITEILPGQIYFQNILESIPIKVTEINNCNSKLDAEITKYNTAFENRKQQIDSKKATVAIKKGNLDSEKQKLESANQNNNYDLAKAYCDRANQMVIEHNKLIREIDEDVRKINQFSENFTNSIQPLKKQIETKKEEYDKLILDLESIRSLLGMKGDNLIEEFLEKVNGLTPLSIRIYSRIVQFEVLISTLSELLIRGINDNEENDSPTIEWYFVQPQINLNDFVKPLNEKNIYTIDDFKGKYKGKINLFKNELMPYLNQKIGRRVLLAEKRKLRAICQANKR
eukprot:54326_1